MILLDTHVWFWWVSSHPNLDAAHRRAIADAESDGIGVSVYSCWEVAKLVEKGKLSLTEGVGEWIKAALAMPGIHLLPLTPEIAVESTQLPAPFHNPDPADQIIVATARAYDCPVLTCDAKILAYPHLKKITIT